MATTHSKGSPGAATNDSSSTACKTSQARDQPASPGTLLPSQYSSASSVLHTTSSAPDPLETPPTLASTNTLQQDMNEQRLIELEEERKLKARNPCLQRPGSEFLQKRLQRGLKYFDSGDYNMAKASTNPNAKLPDVATPITAIDSKILNKK